MKKFLSVLLLPAILLLATCAEDPDPCENVTCENGGVCVSGTCECAEGYKGVTCSQQITPINLIVSKIQVTKFPAFNGAGGNWDTSNGPDIYITIGIGDNVINTTGIVENATTTPLTWSGGTIDLDPTTTYTVRIWDADDPDADDWMAGIIGQLYSTTSGFPEEIIFEADGGTVSYTFTVEYEFD